MSMDVILVRHGKPVPNASQPASAWPLDPDATSGIDDLATALEDVGADVLVSSNERKARKTAEILARHLGVPSRVDDRFGEQGLGSVPWFEHGDHFRAAVARHFEEPAMRTLGAESSTEAAARFANAVDALRGRYRLPIVVTHGRVMTAYTAMFVDIERWSFWSDLRMPDVFALDVGNRTCPRLEGETQS